MALLLSGYKEGHNGQRVSRKEDPGRVCVCARVCRGDDNKAPDEKMLHPCDKRELQDLGFAAASQSSRHCVKMPQIKLIKRKAIMLVCQPDRWHSTALEVGHPSNSSDDGPLPALPRPPIFTALTAAAVISSSLLGPRLPPLAGSSSLPCTLHRLHEWAHGTPTISPQCYCINPLSLHTHCTQQGNKGLNEPQTRGQLRQRQLRKLSHSSFLRRLFGPFPCIPNEADKKRGGGGGRLPPALAHLPRPQPAFQPCFPEFLTL